jgi:hypothetical protein
MREGSGPRRKKLQKISFEELMGAAGMSGFGALLEYPPAKATAHGQPWTESRLRLSIRAAAIEETVVQQNDVLRSLNEPLAERINSLKRVLGVLARMNSAVAGVYSAPAGALHAQPGINSASLHFGV